MQQAEFSLTNPVDWSTLAVSSSTTITMQALLIFAILAVLARDVQGRHMCQPFCCGNLQNIKHPFRQRGDSHRCGVSSYELDCSSSKATIQINKRKYYVTSINYTDSSFWVIDATMQDTNSSCPLPQSDHLPSFQGIRGPHYTRYLVLGGAWPACFVNCSQAVKNNSMYMQVDCLSTSSSFVYVLNTTSLDGYARFENLEPSCGYLAMIPVSGLDVMPTGTENYADFVNFMRKGFTVKFPVRLDHRNSFEVIEECLNQSIRWVSVYLTSISVHP